MSHKPPLNPNKGRVSRVRSFDGIGGAVTKVLKRTNARGNDISNTIANEVQDFDLGERGSLRLRNGKRKIDETGVAYDINSIIDLNIGGLLQYGLVYNGALELIDIPEPDLDGGTPPANPLVLTPAVPTKPADFPTGWPWPDDVVNDYMPGDASLPPEAQVCPESYTIEGDPATLTFTMFEGGSNPVAQDWWFKVEGRWKNALEATFSTSASWYNVSTTGIWSFVTGPCTAVGINQVTIQADGTGLTIDAYTDTLSLTWSDGTILTVVITLNVTAVTLSVAATGFSEKAAEFAGTLGAVVAQMQLAAWANSTPGAVEQCSLSRDVITVKSALTAALVYDTSTINGLDIDTITIPVSSKIDGMDPTMYVQTNSSITPPNNLWTWASSGPTATITSAGSLTLSLSSSVTMDDYIFLIFQYSPWSGYTGRWDRIYMLTSAITITG